VHKKVIIYQLLTKPIMKKLLFIAVAAFCTAALFSYNLKTPEPQFGTPTCYVSCFAADVIEQTRMDGYSKEFASWHATPKPFVLQQATGAMVSFETPDGGNAQGYFIKGKQKSNNYLLVIQEWWGLNDYIKNEAEKMAKEFPNLNVLALDMYDGKVAATPDSAGAYMRSTTKTRLESIVKGGIGYAGKKANIYTVGWCFGGMWSLQSALLAGNQAKGCMMYYGRPETDVEKLKTLNCDVIGFFGNLDRGPSPAMVDQFVKDMETAGKKLLVNRYEAGHGFANPSNPRHNKEATDDAFAKSVAFLKERLK
jgi:carboxymethylenebutenolidase